MDLNLVVLAGRLAAPPEFRKFEFGDSLVRYLVTVRSEEPRQRVDVVPVTLWNPDEAALRASAQPAAVRMRLWVAGGIQHATVGCRWHPAPFLGRRLRSTEPVGDHCASGGDTFRNR